MPTRGSGLGLRLLWRPLGFSLNRCVCYMHIYVLPLKFSSKCMNPNYFFYWFECCHMICPNLSSAPCICEQLRSDGAVIVYL
jgi:hypothetical protein